MSTPPGQEQLNWWLERGGVPVTVANTAAGNNQLMTGIGLITSVRVANPSPTTPAVIFLLDGIDSTSPVLARFAAPVSGNDGMSPCAPGVYFGTGLYVYYVNGFAYVTVTYIPLTLPLK